MRFALVFPPSLCLPNQLYHALPVLAGALRRAGHVPLITDLNLLAADCFLDRNRAEDLLARGRLLAAARERHGDVIGGTELARMLEFSGPTVLEGEASKNVLRDPARYLDQAAFKRAFWNVVDSLGVFYQLDPIISPHREDFARAMIANQTEDPWTPLHELYEEYLIDDVLNRRPDAVGVSVAFPEQAAESVRFARRLRARAPDIHICFGGPLIAGFADRWLEDGWLLDHVDSVCIGDGESTIAELADALEGRRDLESVTNLAWRDGSGRMRGRNLEPVLTRMDDVPVPDFRSARLQLSLTPEPIYPLMLSRGCYWGRCTFCSIGWRENFRIASIDKIRADAVDLVSTYGARYVQIQDSSIPPRGARDLARVVREEKLPLSWVAGMKFEKVMLDPDYCRELAEGGCRSLLIGFESANQRLVDLMDKGVDLEEVPTMLHNLKAAGISTELLWFVGFPTEERGEAFETVRWLHDNRDEFGLSAFVSQYLLHPDTIVGERPDDFGVRVTGQDNDMLLYETGEGLQMDQLETLSKALAHTNNRTLVCNGSHVIHLAENGRDLSGLERPIEIPVEVRHFCDGGIEPARTTGDEEPCEGRPIFLDEDFGFRSTFEASWTDVLDEWNAIPESHRTRWPEQASVVAGSWSLMPLWVAGRRLGENLELCPGTAALLEGVPGLYAASFSLLHPNTMLPLHRGSASFVYRAHLGLVIPERSAIKVSSRVRSWRPGGTIVFDDTLPHFAWNFGDETKVILLLDFLRPGAGESWCEDWDEQVTRDLYYYSRLFPAFADALAAGEATPSAPDTGWLP